MTIRRIDPFLSVRGDFPHRLFFRVQVVQAFEDILQELEESSNERRDDGK